MIKKYIFFIALATQTFAFAQQNPPAVDQAPSAVEVTPLASPVMTEAVVDVTPESVLVAATPAFDTQNMTETFDDWVADFAIKFQPTGAESGGRVFFIGKAPVLGSPTDPNFGQQLTEAYEQAMFDMQADFIMQTYGRIVTNTFRESNEDQSSNNDAFAPVKVPKEMLDDPAAIDGLLNKVIALGEKYLDNNLAEQGIPKDQTKRMRLEEKKVLFKNNLKKDIFKQAYRNMQGLVPVQTRMFTEKTPNGTAVILGVIAVQSEKTRQFAIDMSKKRPTLVKGDPKKITDILPKNNEGYLNEIGLRFTYDANGKPMLISYGRTSLIIRPDWKPSRVVQSKENAKNIAKIRATASISEFMNINIQVTTSTSSGKEDEEFVTQVTEIEKSATGTKSSSNQFRTEIAETISNLMKNAKSSSSADLRGTADVKKWEQVDENGVLHVGTVVSWSYDILDNANAIDAQGQGRTNKAQQQPAINPTLSSKPINKLSDF